MAFVQIMKHLFSMCERATSSTGTTTATAGPSPLINAMKERFAAALSFELLKLGCGKEDKILCKELVKALQSLAIHEWIAPTKVRYMF